MAAGPQADALQTLFSKVQVQIKHVKEQIKTVKDPAERVALVDLLSTLAKQELWLLQQHAGTSVADQALDMAAVNTYMDRFRDEVKQKVKELVRADIRDLMEEQLAKQTAATEEEVGLLSGHFKVD